MIRLSLTSFVQAAIVEICIQSQSKPYTVGVDKNGEKEAFKNFNRWFH